MKKFLNASSIVACLSFVLALVFIIIYAVNINAVGYFQGRGASGVVLFAILVMVFDLLIIARGFVKVEGIVGKVLDIVVFALKVIVPVLLILAAINLIGTRIEGLGYIFFSNADVRKEVATPENVASATTSIVAVVFAGVAAVVSIVGAFFLPKTEKEEPQEN